MNPIVSLNDTYNDPLSIMIHEPADTFIHLTLLTNTTSAIHV